MRKNGWRLRLVLMLAAGMMVLAAGSALAGWNDVTVCTDGDGAPVYAASGASKKAGIMYNGYYSGIGLDEVNGRYDLWLTSDYTVWIDSEKATNRRPVINNYDARKEWEAKEPAGVFAGEILEDDIPVYSAPNHKHITAKHAKGTLVRVCGEFGDDYYIEDPNRGFVAKKSVKKAIDLTFANWNDNYFGLTDLTEATVYATETQPVVCSASATGYSEESYFQVRTENWQTKILRDLGDWVQIDDDAFLEKRFLDPEGDHSHPAARVKTDGKLDRLIVHGNNVKLVSGVPVQVISRTKEWAVIFLTGPNGGMYETGRVKPEYLSFDGNEQIRDGSTKVRLTKELQGDESMLYFAETKRKPGGTIPAGTMLKVKGVYSSGSSESDQSDRFMCETEDGKYIEVDGGEFLEPLESTGLMATARQAVRMREKPNPDSKVLHQVKVKTKVEVLLRGEIWTMVKYRDEVGYMMSRYLSFP